MEAGMESRTSKVCAFVRAWYTREKQGRLCDDYLAYDLLGETEYEQIYSNLSRKDSELYRKEGDSLESVINRFLLPIIIPRMNFLEKRIERFGKNGEKIQYVILGAGSDTFSFRSKNENIEIFEVDHPSTQRKKLQRVDSKGWKIPKNVHYVSVDFETEHIGEALLKAGFQKGKKTIFSIMGVSYYLSLPVFADMLLEISTLSVKGNVVVFDYPQKRQNVSDKVRRLRNFTENLGEKMQDGYDYYEIWRVLDLLGFKIDTLLTPEKVQKKYFENDTEVGAFDNVCLLSAKYLHCDMDLETGREELQKCISEISKIEEAYL